MPGWWGRARKPVRASLLLAGGHATVVSTVKRVCRSQPLRPRVFVRDRSHAAIDSQSSETMPSFPCHGFHRSGSRWSLRVALLRRSRRRSGAPFHPSPGGRRRRLGGARGGRARSTSRNSGIRGKAGCIGFRPDGRCISTPRTSRFGAPVRARTNEVSTLFTTCGIDSARPQGLRVGDENLKNPTSDKGTKPAIRQKRRSPPVSRRQSGRARLLGSFDGRMVAAGGRQVVGVSTEHIGTFCYPTFIRIRWPGTTVFWPVVFRGTILRCEKA